MDVCPSIFTLDDLRFFRRLENIQTQTWELVISAVSTCTYSPKHFHLNRMYIFNCLIYSFYGHIKSILQLARKISSPLSQFFCHVALLQSNPHACVGALLSLLPYIVSTMPSCNLYMYYTCVALLYMFVISFTLHVTKRKALSVWWVLDRNAEQASFTPNTISGSWRPKRTLPALNCLRCGTVWA